MVDIGKKIINYTLNKLFFPKVVVIDKPGLFYSKTSQRYGGKSIKRRQTWHFEDIIVHLQKETIKYLGKKKTEKLYYKIGKDSAIEIMQDARIKKIPHFLMSSTINYILTNFKSAGISLIDKIDYDSKTEVLILKGQNNIFCRKNQQPYFFAGFISGVISYLHNKNIEAKILCRKCPESCLLIANPKYKKKYIPKINIYRPNLKYPIPKNIQTTTKMYSFRDFMKFKKIWINSGGKFCFDNFVIAPSPSIITEIIASYYLGIKENNLLVRSVVSSSSDIAKNLFKKIKSKKQKIDLILQLISAFGFGIPYCKVYDDKIFFKFIEPPFSKYGYWFQGLLVSGFLKEILKCDFKIDKIKVKKHPLIISIDYIKT